MSDQLDTNLARLAQLTRTRALRHQQGVVLGTVPQRRTSQTPTMSNVPSHELHNLPGPFSSHSPENRDGERGAVLDLDAGSAPRGGFFEWIRRTLRIR